VKNFVLFGSAYPDFSLKNGYYGCIPVNQPVAKDMILDELLINSASYTLFWIAWLSASPTISNWRSTPDRS